MKMNSEQLEAFIYISLTGSFSKAAKLLFISQPSISSKIKVLEKELNTILLERTSTKIYLTEEGKAFLPHAQQVIKTIQEGKLSIQNINNEFDGEIHISVVFSGTNYLLPKIIQEFNQIYPNVKLVVYSGHSDQVLKMVLNDEVSMGIVRSISHPQVESIHLEEDEIVLVFHPDHKLSSFQNIDILDLAKIPLILFKRETIDWMLINNAIKRAHLSPNIIMEIDSIEGAKQMVGKNLGISFLPRFSVNDELQNGDLRTASITGIPKIRRNFELIFSKDEQFDRTAKLFSNFIFHKFIKDRSNISEKLDE